MINKYMDNLYDKYSNYLIHSRSNWFDFDDENALKRSLYYSCHSRYNWFI